MTREEWLNAFAAEARPLFKKLDAPLPKVVRMSVGFPSKGKRSNVIGECWADISTEDGVCEIFLRPSLQADTRRIAGVLVHELVHAALGHEEGHGRNFRRVATGLGLEGKMTATTEGEKFYAWADPIIKQLGKFPGAQFLEVDIIGGKKKQTTRMLKVACDACDWSFRTSQQNIDAMSDHTCLACGEGNLQTV
jgi:hypothetical protein